MDLTFMGAARIVTGSRYILGTPRGRIMVDCGMYQGPEHLREQVAPDNQVTVGDLAAVLLTHAHIDHCGSLPTLVRQGYQGRIYATGATTELTAAMLADSAHIQEEDSERDLRKWHQHGRRGLPPEPLYRREDVPPTMELFRSVNYGDMVEIIPGVRARWRDAGHILGSASIEVWVEEDGRETKVVFSGDVGYPGRPLLRDPEVIEDADYLVIESTYGNRRHEAKAIQTGRLAEVIDRMVRNRSHVIVPSFALGRTQELLYELNALIEGRRGKRFPVYVDSPLAVAVTEISRRHSDCFDAETRALLARGDDPFEFPGLHFTGPASESMRLNDMEGPLMIISASGMCTAGRVRHHLRHHLGHGNDTVLMVGYQAAGTLGRLLQDGVNQVRLLGRTYEVRARVETLHGFSAHADVDSLLDWMRPIGGLKGVFVVHGEEEAALDFAALAHRQLGAPTVVPDYRETHVLAEGPMQERLAAMPAIWNRPAVIRTD